MIFNGYLEIEKWITELHEDLAESTVASIFATFSTIMNAVVRTRLIPANPCYGVRVTAGAYETEYLVATPTQALRAAMRLYETLGLSGFVLCLMDFFAGARWGELVGQQAHEYDAERRAITIRTPLIEVGGLLSKGDKSLDQLPAAPITTAAPTSPRRTRGRQRGRTKTPAGTRTVDLPPSIAQFYQLLLASHSHLFVFTTPEGHPLRRSNFRQRYWRRAWDGVDVDFPTSPDHQPEILPWFTFHEGRHTHSTWLIEDGIPEVARRGRLGHKMKGIARTYDHVTPEMRRQIVDALETRWQAALEGLTEKERATLESWFPHLQTDEEPDITGGSRSTTRLQLIMENTEKPSLGDPEKGFLTCTNVLVGDTGIEPVTPTVSR
jgi:integrase